MCTIIDELKERHRWREDYLSAETSMTQRIRSICYRLTVGDKTQADELYKALGTGENPLDRIAFGATMDLMTARKQLELRRKKEEKRLIALVNQLPVNHFVESICGLGQLGVAQILGEAGDIDNYANPAKLWKRFGLAVIGTERQRRVKGPAAIEHGYSPRRRAIMYSIGDSLLKKQNQYRDLYLQRLSIEHQKALDEGLIPVTVTSATVKSWQQRGLPPLTKVTDKKLNPDQNRTAMHLHRRAQRYIEKRLLRDLWNFWRGASIDVQTDHAA